VWVRVLGFNPPSAILGRTLSTARKTKEDIVMSHDAAFADWLLRQLGLSAPKRELLLIEISSPGKKEHWSLTPSFFVLCATAIFAAIAAWPIIHDWIWGATPQHDRGALSQPLEIRETPIPSPEPPTANAPLPVQATPFLSSTPTTTPAEQAPTMTPIKFPPPAP
jgi:hypothetical protein